MLKHDQLTKFNNSTHMENQLKVTVGVECRVVIHKTLLSTQSEKVVRKKH